MMLFLDLMLTILIFRGRSGYSLYSKFRLGKSYSPLSDYDYYYIFVNIKKSINAIYKMVELNENIYCNFKLSTLIFINDNER